MSGIADDVGGLADSAVDAVRDRKQAIREFPRRKYDETVYVIEGIQDGSIRKRDVGKSIVMTLSAFALVVGLLFPIYWIAISAFSGAGGSIYSAEGIKLFPATPSLTPFVWVLGDVVLSSWDVGVSMLGYTVTLTTPEVVFLKAGNPNAGLFGAVVSGTAGGGTVGRFVLGDWVLFEGFAVEPVDSPSEFKRYLGNSLYVSFFTVCFAMSFVVPAAYALSRREFILRGKLLYLYVLFTQIGGGLGIAALIALFALFVQADMVVQDVMTAPGLVGERNVVYHLFDVIMERPGDLTVYNNRFVLSLYYAATAVPFNTWLLKTYMDGIPSSYEEAAYVDGAPTWRIVVEVILPLSKAGLATVFIFTFLTGWMEFLIAQTLLEPANYTLPVGLFQMVGEYEVPWARFSAFALTFASPILVVYLIAQRAIEGGLSFGGMEG